MFYLGKLIGSSRRSGPETWTHGSSQESVGSSPETQTHGLGQEFIGLGQVNIHETHPWVRSATYWIRSGHETQTHGQVGSGTHLDWVSSRNTDPWVRSGTNWVGSGLVIRLQLKSFVEK